MACESASSGDGVVEAFPNRRLQLPTGQTLGFVVNQDSDTMSVIELGAEKTGGLSILTEVPLGRDPVDFDGPRSLVLDDGRQVFYVALTYSQALTSAHVKSARRAGYLQVLARDDLRPLGNIRLKPAVFALALAPDGAEVAVSHYDTELPGLVQGDPLASRAVLAFVDPGAPERAPDEVPLCIAPADLAYAGDESLFVACVGDDAVVRLDRRTRDVSSVFDIDEDAPQKPVWLALEEGGERIAVSYAVTRQVGVLQDGDQLSLQHLIKLEGVPQRAFWLSSTRLLVPTIDPDALVLVDLTTDSIEREIHFDPSDCSAPGALTSSDSGRLFLVCQHHHFEPGTLLELTRDELVVVGRLPLGLFPDRMVLDER